MFKVFPSPADGQMWITVPHHMKGGTISLYNSEGKMILKENATGPREILNTQGILPGVYLLVLEHDGQRFTRKVILK